MHYLIGLTIPVMLFLIGAYVVIMGNAKGYVLMVFAAAVGLGGWWSVKTNYDYEAALAALRATGFQVDEQLQSRPRVVLDHGKRQVALVQPGTTLRYSYDDIRQVDWMATKARGWTNKSASEQSYTLTFHLRDGAKTSVRVNAMSETQARAWQKKLAALFAS